MVYRVKKMILSMTLFSLLIGCKSDQDKAVEVVENDMKNYYEGYESIIVDSFREQQKTEAFTRYDLYAHIKIKGKTVPVHFQVQHNTMKDNDNWVFGGCNCDVISEQLDAMEK